MSTQAPKSSLTLAEQECVALALKDRARAIRRKTARGEDLVQDPFKNAAMIPADANIAEKFQIETLPLIEFPGSPRIPKLLQLWACYGLTEMLAGQRERNRLLCQWVAILYPGQDWDHNDVHEEMTKKIERASRGRQEIHDNIGGHVYIADSDPFLDFWLAVSQQLGPY
jgi:hypothetical protein